ncbi:MAG: kinase-like domain-containing protein, partial [Monoraphidium minutum]
LSTAHSFQPTPLSRSLQQSRFRGPVVAARKFPSPMARPVAREGTQSTTVSPSSSFMAGSRSLSSKSGASRPAWNSSTRTTPLSSPSPSSSSRSSSRRSSCSSTRTSSSSTSTSAVSSSIDRCSCSTPRSGSAAAMRPLGEAAAAPIPAPPAAAAGAEGRMSPSAPHAPLPVDEQDMAAFLELAEADPAPLVRERRAAHLLGEGGEGAVVEVVLSSRRFALKQESGGSGKGVPHLHDSASPFVQRQVANARASDAKWYSLYNLAAGDLQSAWHVQQPAATTAVPATRKLPLWRRSKAAATKPELAPAAAPRAASIAAARPIMAEAVAGVAAVHAKGQRHGDIKPSNFLVAAGTGHIKLADFGMAGGCDRLPPGGTHAYAAPEVLVTLAPPTLKDCLLEALCLKQQATTTSGGGGRACDDSRPSDVFSLGVTFAELAAGPAGAAAALNCAARALAGAPLELPPALAADGPLAALLAAMLAADPAARPAIAAVKAHPFFAGIDWAELEVYGAAGRPPLLQALEEERARADTAAADAAAARRQGGARRGARELLLAARGKLCALLRCGGRAEVQA